MDIDPEDLADDLILQRGWWELLTGRGDEEAPPDPGPSTPPGGDDTDI